MSKQRLLLGGIFALLVIFCAYTVWEGIYPVMVVNNSLVLKRTFDKKYNAALAYYESALKTYGGFNKSLSDTDRKEMQRGVLEVLAEETLIHRELKRREPKELNAIVKNKLQETLENAKDFEIAAQTLYGFNLDEAKKYLLAPQAEREILEGRLFMEKREFKNWLSETKRNARVLILVPGFSWKNGGVVAE